MTGAGMPTCPACASSNVAPIPDGERRDDGDELTADVAPPSADPPNMRCAVCGHTWWSPDASKAR